MFNADDGEVEELSEDVQYFMCIKCEKAKFENYHIYKQHVMKVHCLKNAPILTCNVCFASYTTVPEILAHGKKANHKSN
jgi:hypothetical protein